MNHLASVFIAQFVFVFLKAFQQRNVQHNDWAFVFPTSMGMALVEVYVFATVATRGFGVPLVLSIGCGAGLGCLAAMFIHNLHLKRKQQ